MQATQTKGGEWLRRVRESGAAWGFLGTGLRAFAGALLLPLLAHQLAPAHLGLWYVFVALGAVTMLVDFGVAPALSRAVGYAWAGADKLLPEGVASTPPTGADARRPNYELVAGLIGTARVRYRRLTLVVLALLLVVGTAWVWLHVRRFPDANSLVLVWIVFALGTGWNTAATFWPALLNGINGVRQAHQINLLGTAVYCAVAITGLLLGVGLWALVIANLMQAGLVRAAGQSMFFKLAGSELQQHRMTHQPELLAAIRPMALRAGLVHAGSYLMIQANMLVCGALLGLETTASYGLSFQIAGLLGLFSGIWVQVKMPVIHQLRATGDNRQIASLFAGRMRLTLLTYALGCAAVVVVAPASLEMLGTRTRLLELQPLLLMLLILGLEMHHSHYAGLVLTENRNPFVVPSLVSGACIVTGSVLLAPQLGVWGLLISAGAVQACYNNWWPVWRAVHGLGLGKPGYWSIFFGRAGR